MYTCPTLPEIVETVIEDSTCTLAHPTAPRFVGGRAALECDDAWGQRRHPGDAGVLAQLTRTSALHGHTTTRGFTGHEMLDAVGIIHMNGRIYDPKLGRFLQPDPVIQFPDYSQGWNTYSYVLNNPLTYTDPGQDHTLSHKQRRFYSKKI